MRRRILLAIFTVAALAIALFAVPLAFVVERLVDGDAMLRVERQAILAARVVPGDFATNHDPVELPPSNAGIHLALYDPSGSLVAGSGPQTADKATIGALANHVTDDKTDGTRVVAVPVSVDERLIGVIRAEQSTAASEARTRRIVLLLGSLAIGVVAIGAGIGYMIAGRLARPVLALRDAAVQLGNGDFTLVVPRSKILEIDQTGVAMTATASRLDDLVTRERSFSADASHQLRTPLAGLRAAIETELEFPRPDHTVALRESLDDIDRLERTIAELLRIARTPRIDDVTTTISRLFAEIDAAWRSRLAQVGRPLTIGIAHDAPDARGNPVMLRHALDVLLDNALTHGAGEVQLDHTAATDTVTITVADDGPGFVHGAAERTVDSTDHGLGLPLAKRLIEALPGRLVMRRSSAHPQIDIVLQRADSAAAE